MKQALLNRVRAWFEQGKVVFPFGDDETRKIVRVLLEELESHAWVNGVIVDKGKHNDCVMAFAHAIDQFVKKVGSMPMASSSVSDNWMKGGKQKRVNRRPTGRYVSTDW